MKCKQIIKQYGHLRYAELPDHVRGLVDQDPTCREWFAHSDAQRDLLSLKSHEQPEPALHGRVTYKVMTRIEAGERLPAPELDTTRHNGLGTHRHGCRACGIRSELPLLSDGKRAARNYFRPAHRCTRRSTSGATAH